MTYDEVLDPVVALLQRDKRMAYRVLKRRFSIDDEYVEDLKVDLIDAKWLDIDEDGKVLVWVGQRVNGKTAKRRRGSSVQSPGSRVRQSRAQSLKPGS